MENDLILLMDNESDLVLELNEAYGQHYDEYSGPYIVKPILYNEQVLTTRSKVMTDNVTVREIPIVQTVNPLGGKTVVIG